MDRLLQDLRFAFRLLWKDRGFTLTTVATLALCVAANTSIFAVVNAVLLKPLPFPEPERLVTIFNSYPGAGAVRAANGVPDYYDRLAQTTVFDEIAMYRSSGVTIGGQGGGEVERVTSLLLTPSFFRLLHAQPHRGQLFTEQDAEVGQPRKVVLGYGTWQRLFAGSDDAVGRDLRINGELHTVVGVLPDGFHFIDPEVQLWTPAAFSAEERSDERRHSNSWQQIARLEPGATLEQAQAQIDAINAANLDRFPQLKQVLVNAGFHTQVKGFHADLVESSRGTLYLLWGGVLAVLVIGCVNVANLVSVRASGRVRELATRHALGASMQRLSRQILTESVLVSVIGGALGLALGWLALSLAAPLALDQLPRGESIAIDGVSLAFVLGLVLLVGVVVGLFPMAALRRADLGQIVREEGRSGTASRRTRLVRRALVTSQVAFALVLLVGAGLLLASFQRVLAVSPGFVPDQVLAGSVSFPASRYADDAAIRMAATRVLDRVRTVPGVLAAGATTTMPMSGQHNDSVIFAEGYQPAPGESLISPNQVWVTPGYFEAMQTAVRAGRPFDQRDVEGAPRTIIVDELLARKYWPGQDPIGRHMYFPASMENLLEPPPREQWMTVIGVVEHVRLDGLVDGPGFRTVGAYYLPYDQNPSRNIALAVRTSQDPTSITGALRAELASVDPELPLYGVRTMQERVDRSLVDRRTPMVLALTFAAVALFLAAIGIYGVLAYQVSQRSREIGIRMALGAAAISIFGMVLREGAAIVLIGTALGLIGAFMLRQTLQSQLYEIGAMDPTVIAIVGGILLAVALAATLLPARRAAKTDPVHALMGQ
ncbi:MAG TPA: ABC transporter permease [Vicinamibacterales bacterium]|nr:ABC transporter permease [Vicinamibacterales bacterium]